MLACEVSVTTAWACAKSKRAPWAASRSRFGVTARPPYEPSASARSVSMVTRRMLRSAFGATENADGPLQAANAKAPKAPRHQGHKRLGARALMRGVTNRMRHVAIGLLILAALVAGIFGAYKLMGKPAQPPAVRTRPRWSRSLG